MSRPKKDGRYINCYLDSQIYERLEKYCEDTGLTKTVAIERILKQRFDEIGVDQELKKLEKM